MMIEPVAKRAPRVRRKVTPDASEPVADLVVTHVTVDDDGVAQQKHIAERLVMLRTEFQGIIASYSVRVQGMLSEAGDVLNEDPVNLSAANRKRREKALQRILEGLGTLDLKPSKGRRRDLKAIEGFAKRLSDEVAAW